MRLDTFFIWLTMPMIAGCATYKIETNTPTFLDPVRGHGRVYRAEKVEPNKCGDPEVIFKHYGETKQISDMAGYICIPPDQFQYNKRYYDEYNREKQNCQN